MSATDTQMPADGSELMRQFIPNSPFAKALDLRLDEIEPGRAVLSMPYDPTRATMGDVVHGGAIATLADTCAMAASWAGAEVPAQLRGATVSLTVNYTAAAVAADLVAEGLLVRRGGSLCTVDVTVRTAGEDGKIVAKALASYKVG